MVALGDRIAPNRLRRVLAACRGLALGGSKGAGETAAPIAGTQPYALNELARTQKVGAALSSAVSHFDTIVKQHPSDREHFF